MTASSPSGAATIATASLDLSSPSLRLAAEAWPENERASQLATLSQHLAGGCGGDFLLVEARRGELLVGAMLAQRLAGKAAVVWLPQVVASEGSSTRQDLLAAMGTLLSMAGTRLAQCLLDVGARDDANVLNSVGYVHAGKLLYMAAPAESFPHQPPPSALTFEPYTPEHHDRLVRIVEATYRGSLDCPLIDGLRETADVLAGYRAVGHFRPDWWLIARHNGRDAGCLLLADHVAERQAEIVYAGIVPELRGRRFGFTLTRIAQWLACQASKLRLVLAVDAANAPANAMYRAAGCIVWDHRSVWVQPICRDSS